MLQVINLTKSFGEVKAVDNVTLRIGAGERVVLLGPSGCGKTTILRLIAGFERPDEGRIILKNVEVSSPDRVMPPHRRKIGMVFQDLALWPHLTAREHLLFCMDARKKARERIDAILEMAGLEAHVHRYPHELSGGEKQRLALARALASEPELLLMDEPLTSLDPVLKEELLGVVLDMQDRLKTTMMYVTHDLQEAHAFSEKGVILRAGRVEQKGYWNRIIAEPASHFVEFFMKGPKHGTGK